MHFIHKILCFEEFLHKIALFFKKLYFPDFRSIEPVARLIENAIKILFCFESNLLNHYWINRKLFLIDRIYFSINRKSYREFFKTFVSHVFCHFQTILKTPFSLYSIGPRSLARFLSFSSKFR